MRQRLRELLSSRQWEATIIALIVVNAITLGLETMPAVMARFGDALVLFDRLILAIFVVEIALRIIAHGWRFFRDPWGIFDFSIVAIALIPATGAFSVLRILRVLRLISVVPSLRRVIGGLIAALPGLGSIIVLMVLVFYVFAVMATNLFGPDYPAWFGGLDASALTLFQMMTFDSWSSGIMRPILESHPWAWAFFIPFVFVTALTVLNLFIGVIVSAMQEEHSDAASADRARMRSDGALVLGELRALRAELAALRSEHTTPRNPEPRA